MLHTPSCQSLFTLTTEYINNIFSKYNIPSHDTSHHIRTWYNAKKIADIAPEQFSDKKLEALMIACLFHDTGLSVTKSEKHGNYSALIFNDFCKQTGYSSAYNKCIYKAIIDHDKKDYINRDKKDRFSIYNILPVADDLDALGYIGIFRYAEIYVLRGLSTDDIPCKILKNATGRWNNLKSIYRESNLSSIFEDKYRVLTSFYNNNDKHVANTFINYIADNTDKYRTIEELTEMLLLSGSDILKTIATEIRKETDAINRRLH
jgi:hypothetical protein